MHGISLNSWARVDGKCPVTYRVIAGEAEFDIGASPTSMSLNFTLQGLESVTRTFSEALEQMRAERADQETAELPESGVPGVAEVAELPVPEASTPPR